MSGMSSTVQTVAPVVSVAPVSVSPVSVSVSPPLHSLKDLKFIKSIDDLERISYFTSFNLNELNDDYNYLIKLSENYENIYKEEFKDVLENFIKSNLRKYEDSNKLIYRIKVIIKKLNVFIGVSTFINAKEEEVNETYIKNFECSLCYEEAEQETRNFCFNNHNINICVDCLERLDKCPYCKNDILDNSKEDIRLMNINFIELYLKRLIIGYEVEDTVNYGIIQTLNEINNDFKEKYFYNKNLLFPVSLKEIINDMYDNKEITNIYINTFEAVGVYLNDFIIRDKKSKEPHNMKYDFINFLLSHFVCFRNGNNGDRDEIIIKRQITAVYDFIYSNFSNESSNKIFIKPYNSILKCGMVDILVLIKLFKLMINNYEDTTIKEIKEFSDKLLSNCFLLNKNDDYILNHKNSKFKDDEIKFKYQNKIYKYKINDYSENDINLYIIETTKNKNGKITFNNNYEYIKFNIGEEISIIQDFREYFSLNYFKFDHIYLYNLILQIIHNNSSIIKNRPLKFMIIKALEHLKEIDGKEEFKNDKFEFFNAYFDFGIFSKLPEKIMKDVKYKDDIIFKFFEFDKNKNFKENDMNLYLIFNSGDDKKKLIKYYHNYENLNSLNMLYESYSKGYYYFSCFNNQSTRQPPPRVVELESDSENERDSDDESDDEPAIRNNSNPLLNIYQSLNPQGPPLQTTQPRPDDSDDDDETGGEIELF